jgi:NIMA (never in mitosis gene a)-related kinase
MASSQQPPPPRLSDFTLKKKLGEGSYSQVSLALRKFDGLDYALKQVNIAKLNEKERENALNEVRFLASIRHKNIIGYRAAFIDDQSKTLCIVMEFANDGDLLGKVHDMRRKGTFFSEQEIWRIFIQLALGLQCLHQMNIMHRDLKPANIFLWKGNS